MAFITYMNITSEQELILQGRLGARMVTAVPLAPYVVPVGAAASVGAITRDVLSAGSMLVTKQRCCGQFFLDITDEG